MILNIEICLNPSKSIDLNLLEEKVTEFLYRSYLSLPLNHKLNPSEFQLDIFLLEHVAFIQIDELVGSPSKNLGFVELNTQDLLQPSSLSDNDTEMPSKNPSKPKVEFIFHYYSLVDDCVEEERFLSASKSSSGEPELCKKTLLPSSSFDGQWEQLVFDDDIKQRLLEYMKTALLFGDKGIDQNIISINRVCLLYGPPGTGKTTLAKALAQKITIRMGKRYGNGGVLVEINPNAIFSKFFAESAKLLLKMFNELHEILQDEESFVCLLMDEVESLTAARKAAMNGNEPSDAIRVVNCLLTQIDKLKKRGNVLVIATSNITEAIDVAFIDRADIKQYIGEPSASATYTILRSALLELMRPLLVFPRMPICSWQTLHYHDSLKVSDEIIQVSARLKIIANTAQGLSGRTLTKIPFLAYSLWMRNETRKGSGDVFDGVSVSAYLDALDCVIQERCKSDTKSADQEWIGVNEAESMQMED